MVVKFDAKLTEKREKAAGLPPNPKPQPFSFKLVENRGGREILDYKHYHRMAIVAGGSSTRVKDCRLTKGFSGGSKAGVIPGKKTRRTSKLQFDKLDSVAKDVLCVRNHLRNWQVPDKTLMAFAPEDQENARLGLM